MGESSSAEIQEEANASIINNVNENSESEWAANSRSGNESQNREANASIRNQHQDRVLANDIKKMIEKWEPPLSVECCIYRVPHGIRKVNEEAYTPQVISIGPFHRGDERLETMEKLKISYFKIFVKMAKLNVEELVSYIRDMEGEVHRYYAETSTLCSDDYVKMILLDASFIIVFFLMFKHEEWRRLSEDNLIASPRSIAIAGNDLWLLENQLPFFVIDELYNLAFPSPSNYPSFIQLTYEFYSLFNTQNMSPDPKLEIMHFVDLIRTFFLPKELPKRGNLAVEHLYTASQLHEAGVKFKAGSSKCLFDLKFKNGVLEIPCFKLYRDRESLFRNLMALEQCYYLNDAYISDYIRLLDFLIDTAQDVDLFVRKRILLNRLGDSNTVTTLVNNLCRQLAYINMNADYCNLCNDLNTFYEVPRHSWKATLRHDYFSTPWRIASTVAAIILLVLTFTQTLCSIISLL